MRFLSILGDDIFLTLKTKISEKRLKPKFSKSTERTDICPILVQTKPNLTSNIFLKLKKFQCNGLKMSIVGKNILEEFKKRVPKHLPLISHIYKTEFPNLRSENRDYIVTCKRVTS